MSATELAAVDRARDQCLATVVHVVRSPIEQADREDSIAAWLADHAADTTIAETLAESALTFEGLDQLADALDSETLDVALRSIAALCVTRRLAAEIEAAGSRISRLVAAVKGFTYMDQAAEAKPVDIGQGLADTLAVLQSKARTKSAGVTIRLEPDLPPVQGFGGELNQVWANLVDNALDAVPEGGHVHITATRHRSTIVVSVMDDGPGISAEIQERIFDPFLHHETSWRGHRPGPRHREAPRQPARWRDRGGLAARADRIPGDPAGALNSAGGKLTMAKPVIMTVDDDREVLGAIERDLRQHYRSDYRILRASSGREALEAARELKQRAVPIALFLVDQRMPHMTGTELLGEVGALYPDARKVLLTAYADTQAAIDSINKVGLDHYLMKPWDPPDQRLYPVLDDLLSEWTAHVRLPFDGIRVAGARWSRPCYEAREFLSRNHVPYQWIDIDHDAPTRELVNSLAGSLTRLPVILFTDGRHLIAPTHLELADAIGLTTRAKLPFYDLVIIGGGPAGLANAVYGASEGLRTLMIEQRSPGGQAGTSSRIENYLGFPAGITGADLAQRAVAQARRFGAEILAAQEVVGVRREDPYRIVRLADGSEVSCYAVLLATGMEVRILDVPGLGPLVGAGVYYGAAMSEAFMYRGQDVCIVGGGNSAGQGALFFSRYARRVTMLVHAKGLAPSMSPVPRRSHCRDPSCRSARAARGVGRSRDRPSRTDCGPPRRHRGRARPRGRRHVHFHRRRAALRDGGRRCRAGRQTLHPHRTGPASNRAGDQRLDARPRSVSVRDERPRHLCRWRRARGRQPSRRRRGRRRLRRDLHDPTLLGNRLTWTVVQSAALGQTLHAPLDYAAAIA